MKSFRAWVQQVGQWRQRHLPNSSETGLELIRRCQLGLVQGQTQGRALANHAQQLIRTYLKPASILDYMRSPVRFQRKKYVNGRMQQVVLLTVAVLLLTSAIGYRFYNEPQLGVETIAPQTLRAPASAKVIDTKTTEANRKAARLAAVPVLTIDQSANQDIYRALQRLLDRGDELRQQAGAFPYLDTAALSTPAQRYLRQTEEWNWRMALASIEGVSITPAPASEESPSSVSDEALRVAISELRTYRRSNSVEDVSALIEVSLRARQRYKAALAALTAEPSEINFYDASLFSLSDSDWNQLKVAIRGAVERILSQGIAPGLPDPILEAAIQTQLQSDLPPNLSPIAAGLLGAVLKPNLVQDPEQTKLRAEQAAQAVENVVVEIRRGEVVVQAGKRITQTDFVLLDSFGLSRRRINWGGLLGFGALISGAVALFLVVEHRYNPGLRRRDYGLILLLILTVPLVLALNLPSSNLPAIGLLVGSFYGSALGVTTVGLLSILLPIGLEVTWNNWIASAIGGLLGAAITGHLRSREELAMLGGAVGLTQGVVYLLLSLMMSTATQPVWYVVLTSAALQCLMGLTWSIVALGLSPYMERFFDLITPIRLAELANPNRPLLKRLASEAPGTFQHTLFVATLAEAAARALGCNVELVRAGTLYHDIGKMHDPLGFIENQMGGPNKHDLIDDPWQSATIIKKHVSEGLVMARRCHLPKAIQAFIPEHQGEMPISYFYHQALERAKADPTLIVEEADFRYSGPRPQSRETGIVMLADSCEAALRSLKDASPDEALAMVNRILRARWQDQQLSDSSLSRAEMSTIGEIFVQVWQQSNHQRIPYPKAALSHREPVERPA